MTNKTLFFHLFFTKKLLKGALLSNNLSIMRILVFGDSIADGFWDFEKGGWVNRLKIDLWKNEELIEVCNCGISGDNSRDLLKRFNAFKNAYNEKYKDELIIIFSIGLNDSHVLENSDTHIDLIQFHENLLKLIDLCKADKLISNIFFLTNINIDETRTHPTSWNHDIYYKNAEIENYNNVIKDTCNDKGIEYLDLYGFMKKTDLIDGLHPTSQGHEKIFLAVKDFLKKYIL